MRNSNVKKSPSPVLPLTLLAPVLLTLSLPMTPAPLNAQGGGGSGGAYPDSRATLLAYLPFDDSPLVQEAARDVESEAVDLSSATATEGLRTSGRYGGGIRFRSGSGQVLIPLNLDFRSYPQVTISLWLRVSPDHAESWPGGYLISTGAARDGTPALSLYNDEIAADAGYQKLVNHAGSLPVDEWIHVAGVWDYEARTVRLYTGEHHAEWEGVGMDPAELAANGRTQSMLDHPLDPENEEFPPQPYVVLGAQRMGGGRAVEGVSVDDVRIYAGAMTPEEIATIRESPDPAPLGRIAAPPPPRPRIARPEEDGTGAGSTGAAGDGDRGELVGWTLSEDYELSEVSGSTGDKPKRAEFTGADEDHAYVRGMKVREQGNRPCMVSVAAQVPGELAHAAGYCDGTNSTVQLETTLSRGFAATGVQVCQRRTNDRVKGLRLTGSRWELDQDAGIRLREEAQETDEAPNCNGNWQPAVSCPAGMVASGAVGHFRSGSSGGVLMVSSPEEDLVGVQLVCRRMVGVYRGTASSGLTRPSPDRTSARTPLPFRR